MGKPYIEIPAVRSHLTHRQWEVLRSIVTQEPGPATSARLQISLRTLETHKRNVRDRFGVDDNHELIMATIEYGLIEDIVNIGGSPYNKFQGNIKICDGL